MAFESRGKNGNVLMGRHAHPVRCFDGDGNPIKTFRTLRDAADWLVHNGMASSRNSGQVTITHAINGKQHYWGKDHTCKSAFGLFWKNA